MKLDKKMEHIKSKHPGPKLNKLIDVIMLYFTTIDGIPSLGIHFLDQ